MRPRSRAVAVQPSILMEEHPLCPGLLSAPYIQKPQVGEYLYKKKENSHRLRYAFSASAVLVMIFVLVSTINLPWRHVFDRDNRRTERYPRKRTYEHSFSPHEAGSPSESSLHVPPWKQSNKSRSHFDKKDSSWLDSPEVDDNSPIALYLRAMNDPSVYVDSEFAFTADIQKAIYKHQNPSSCLKSKFLIYHVWSHGFGSFARGMSIALSMAIASDRVLLLAVGPAPPYVNKSSASDVWKTWNHGVGCDRVHPECFLKPVSGCSLNDTHNQMMRKEISYAELDDESTYQEILSSRMSAKRVLVARSKLNWLQAFRKNIPVRRILDALKVPTFISENEYFATSNRYAVERIWTMQAMVYLLRLNEEMQMKVRDGLVKCFKSENPSLHRIIGLPIRASDKCYRYVDGKRHGEASCVTLADTMSLAARIHSSQPWIDTLLITSEDPEVLKSARTIPEMVLGSSGPRRWKILTNSDDVQQGTGSSSSRDISLGEAGVLPSSKITESILTTLACQLLPSHRIVLMKSNFGDIIDMLSKAVPGRRVSATLNSGAPTFPS